MFSLARHRVPSAPTRLPQVLIAAFPSGFVRHPSVSSWLWIDFPASTVPAIPPEATAQRSARAYYQTAVSSDGPPPIATNNSGHVSLARISHHMIGGRRRGRDGARDGGPARLDGGFLGLGSGDCQGCGAARAIVRGPRLPRKIRLDAGRGKLSSAAPTRPRRT